MDELFTAADITGLFANCSTVLVAFIGVALALVAFRYLQRAMGGGTVEYMTRGDAARESYHFRESLLNDGWTYDEYKAGVRYRE